MDKQEGIEEYTTQAGTEMEQIHRALFEVESEYTIKISMLGSRSIHEIIYG